MLTTMSISTERILQRDETKDYQWFPWSKKIRSKCLSMGFLFILQIAMLNHTATRLKGLANFARFLTKHDPDRYPEDEEEELPEEEDPGEDYNSEEGVKAMPARRETLLLTEMSKREIKFASKASGRILPLLPTRKLSTLYQDAQVAVYHILCMGTTDVLGHITDLVDEDDEECGTLLWTEFLREFADKSKIAKSRIIMDLTSISRNIKEAAWEQQAARIKRLITTYNSTGTPLTVEDVVSALCIQSMLNNRKYRQLGTSLLNSEELDFSTIDYRAKELDGNLQSAQVITDPGAHAADVDDEPLTEMQQMMSKVTALATEIKNIKAGQTWAKKDSFCKHCYIAGHDDKNCSSKAACIEGPLICPNCGGKHGRRSPSCPKNKTTTAYFRSQQRATAARANAPGILPTPVAMPASSIPKTAAFFSIRPAQKSLFASTVSIGSLFQRRRPSDPISCCR
mmetsp:Transcript_18175/g.36713  ORF Transcript_18175/g.36713 Transcript_18175/m.36713 type:complete len:455 (+) Transcript_18175:416-1780(+)